MREAFSALTWHDLPFLILTIYLSGCVIAIIHEVGHYAFARLVRIPIDRFEVGHWLTVCNTTYSGTHFEIRLLWSPLRMDYTGRVSPGTGTYTHSSVMWLLLGGSIANILTGAITLCCALWFTSVTLFYFSAISILNGLANLLPLPGFDGWYILNIYRYGALDPSGKTREPSS